MLPQDDVLSPLLWSMLNKTIDRLSAEEFIAAPSIIADVLFQLIQK